MQRKRTSNKVHRLAVANGRVVPRIGSEHSLQLRNLSNKEKERIRNYSPERKYIEEAHL